MTRLAGERGRAEATQHAITGLEALSVAVGGGGGGGVGGTEFGRLAGRHIEWLSREGGGRLLPGASWLRSSGATGGRRGTIWGSGAQMLERAAVMEARGKCKREVGWDGAGTIDFPVLKGRRGSGGGLGGRREGARAGEGGQGNWTDVQGILSGERVGGEDWGEREGGGALGTEAIVVTVAFAPSAEEGGRHTMRLASRYHGAKPHSRAAQETRGGTC